jgi:UTP--glucose-1-phosphate uridylyltransferase
LKNKQKIYAYNFRGKRYDAGDKVEYIQAIIDFALSNNEIRKPVLDYLKKVSQY